MTRTNPPRKRHNPSDNDTGGTPGDEVVVCYGSRVLACYERGDRGMRNLAIVALTRAGISGVEVAALFGVRPEHVSRLRRLAGEAGSAGLVPVLGRPVKLDQTRRRRAFVMADEGRSGAEIARELAVSAATISRLLGRRTRDRAEQLDLDGDHDADDHGDHDADGDGGDAGEVGCGQSGGCGRVARIADGSRHSRYGGAMLLHGFLDRSGAGAVLAGLPSNAGRRYDAAALVMSATFGFALGSSSAEGTKHLLSVDAGALVGLERFPHLRSLRPRLGVLAEAVDPLGVQVALAKAMLAADEAPPEVFFVDDHFVAYTGAGPVAKGWNTRRRHAEAGRDDTLIVDDTWRAICFASGPPSGLSKTMFAPLDQLREVLGDRPAMIGFDRGEPVRYSV